MNNSEHWADGLEARLRELLPIDFPDRIPVYIRGKHELGEAYDHPWPCLAYTSPTLDLRLQRNLEMFGTWRGRGFACVLFTEGFRTLNPGPSRFLAMMDTVLHEAAHWLCESSQSILVRPVDSWPDWLRDFEPRFRGVETETEAPEPLAEPPWAMHEYEFIRSALHVLTRANAAGHQVNADQMNIAGEYYGLSAPENYAKALGQEVTERSREPLVDVLRSQAPKSYETFWKQDLAKAKARLHSDTNRPRPVCPLEGDDREAQAA